MHKQRLAIVFTLVAAIPNLAPGDNIIDGTHTVKVKPHEKTIAPIPMRTYGNDYDGYLFIVPENGYQLLSSRIVDQDRTREPDMLWRKREQNTRGHTYEIVHGYSGQEWLRVHGSIAPDGNGGGRKGSVPQFDVAVPEIDIDWEGLEEWEKERKEDSEIAWISDTYVRKFIIRRPKEYVLRWPGQTLPNLTLTWQDSFINIFSNASCSENNRVIGGGNGTLTIPSSAWNGRSRLEFWAKRAPNARLQPTETFIRIQREKTNFDEEGFNLKTWDMIWCEAVRADMDVDTNNDGHIENDNYNEDLFEEYEPGLLLTRSDPEANLEGAGELRQVLFRGYPVGFKNLTVKLEQISGDGRVRFFVSNNAGLPSQTLPIEWNTDTAPSPPNRLYVQGVSSGAVKLKYSFIMPNGKELSSDIVHITVLEPASYAPGGGSFAAVWMPLKSMNNTEGNNLGWDEATAFVNELSEQGWTHNSIIWMQDTTGDGDTNFGTCTLGNLLAMRNAGALFLTTHGSPGYMSAIYAEHTPAGIAALNLWRVGIAGAQIIDASQYYFVRIPSSWFEINWSAMLNSINSIVFWAFCHSADKTDTLKSIMDSGGGRWRVGSCGETSTLTDYNTVNRFFRKMNGKNNSGNRRTAGEAYADGAGYRSHVRMAGNKWTTLCPALAKGKWIYPSSQVSEKRKGWGCVVFDTYMDSSVSAASIVTGSGINNIRWLRLGNGNRAIGFDFDSPP
jgi:hypothetical protein